MPGRAKKRARSTYNRKRGPRHKKRRAPKKSKTYHDRMRKTTDTKLRLNRWRKKSLKERVSALETTTSKHHDTAQTGLAAPHKINWNGVSYTGAPIGDPRNSFKAALMIKPRMPDGEVQRFSGNDTFNGSVTTQRNDKSVFAKSLRLRGKILGLRPKPLIIDGSGTDSGAVSDSNVQVAQDCYTKVWMVVLEDQDPGKVSLLGATEPNDYEGANSGMSPIESIGQCLSSGPNTLQIYGYGQMLKSYNSQRFKVHSSQAYIMTANKPQVEFDVTIDINRELQYEVLEYDSVSPLPATRPVNYGILVYFLYSLDTTGPIDYTKYHAPETRHLTSRLKFLD